MTHPPWVDDPYADLRERPEPEPRGPCLPDGVELPDEDDEGDA